MAFPIHNTGCNQTTPENLNLTYVPTKILKISTENIFI